MLSLFLLASAGMIAAGQDGAPAPSGLSPITIPAEEAAPAAADDPSSTAVSLREADTRMTVAVMINGAGPFRFIVDSGATRTVISSRLAALLSLPSAGMASLHAVGGESQVETVRIDRLALGALPAQPIVAPILEEANLGCAGILGIDALAGKKVVIDLIANRMTVVPADRSHAEAGTDEIIVTARRRYGQLVLVDADAAGQSIYAILDTGSMVTIGNGELQTRLVRHKRAVPEITEITDVTGRTIPAVYAAVHDVRLGSWHLRNSYVAFSDAHAFGAFGLATKPSMLLRMDMMRAFSRVSIDFKRKTVRLLRRNEQEEAVADRRPSYVIKPS